MKKLIFILISFISILYSQNLYFKYKQITPKSSNKITVLKKKLSNTKSSNIISLAQIFHKDDKFLEHIYIVKASKSDVEKLKNELKNDENVEYVSEPISFKVENSLPNDPGFYKQWYLNKCKILDALDYVPNSNVLVGIIDTGIDYNHEDLQGAFFINPGETGIDENGNDKRFNGIDDDNNGFVDDYSGYDFVNRFNFTSDYDFSTPDNNPMDEHGHGTNVAGIISATKNNNIGISGISSNIKLLNIRAFDKTGNASELDVALGVIYAIQMGCKVINMSFGDTKYSQLLYDVINYAYSKNVTIVASAGNSNSFEPHYPSFFQEVISVGASDENDKKAGFSNYGNRIDIVAPGTNIYTTDLYNNYTTVSGTSFSTPIVSAISALLLAKNPDFSPTQIKNILKLTADDIEQPGSDILSGSGRLNALNALKYYPSGIFTIHSPVQDSSYFSDTININYSVLLPNYSNHKILLGIGTKPNNWTTLIDNLSQQGANLKFTLSTKDFYDTTYTLKIIVYTSNNSTIESSVTFYIVKKNINIYPIFLAPLNNGTDVGFATSVYTDKRAKAYIHYRQKGSSNFITSVITPNENLNFKDYFHYGKIINNDLGNCQIECYFEAKINNQSFINNNNGKYFTISIPDKNYSYDANKIAKFDGNEIFSNTFQSSDSANDIVLIYKNNRTYFYYLNNSTYPIDSIENFKAFLIDDFDKDGKTEIIGRTSTNLVIYKFSDNKLVKIYDQKNSYFPANSYDLNNNGIKNIFFRNTDTTFIVTELKNNSLQIIHVLKNFSKPKYYLNTFRTPSIAIGNINNDNLIDIFAIDGDGDIICWNYSNNNFTNAYTIETEFPSQGNCVISNNKLYFVSHTSNEDIVPLYILFTLTTTNNQTNLTSLNVFYDDFSDFNLNLDIKLKQTHNFIGLALPNAFYIYEDNSTSFSTSNNNDIIFINKKFKQNVLISNNIVNIIYYSSIMTSNYLFTTINNSVYFSENISNKIEIKTLNKTNVKIKKITFTQLNNSNVLIEWDAPLGDYNVFKTNNKINIITKKVNGTSLIDTIDGNYIYYAVSSTLSPDTFYKYSPLSQTILKSYSTDIQGFIKLTFNNPLNTNFYSDTMIKFNDKTLTFSTITFSSPNEILIKLNNYKTNVNYQITQLTIKDINNRINKFNGINFIFTQQNNKPINFFVKKYELQNDYTIKIFFNDKINKLLTTQSMQVSFIPQNELNTYEILDSAIILNVKQKPLNRVGIDTKITLNGVYSINNDSLTNVNNEIFISPMYNPQTEPIVYPNPYITSKHKSVIFSNLPADYDIYILSIEGNIINTISGKTKYYEWDGKDKENKSLNSGIYIYKIYRRTNSTYNEIKTGKIAIIK